MAAAPTELASAPCCTGSRELINLLPSATTGSRRHRRRPARPMTGRKKKWKHEGGGDGAGNAATTNSLCLCNGEGKAVETRPSAGPSGQNYPNATYSLVLIYRASARRLDMFLKPKLQSHRSPRQKRRHPVTKSWLDFTPILRQQWLLSRQK